MTTRSLFITPIRDGSDHRRALAHIDALMEAEPATPELNVLATLVAAYECRHHGMPPPTSRQGILLDSSRCASGENPPRKGFPSKAKPKR